MSARPGGRKRHRNISTISEIPEKPRRREGVVIDRRNEATIKTRWRSTMKTNLYGIIAALGVAALVAAPASARQGNGYSMERAFNEGGPYTPSLNPLQRLGTPDDIAAAVAFLVGADGAWINGQVLRANGGMI
jgi:hypothetical protein